MPSYVQASSANDGAAVTPSDSTVVAFDAVYVGGTGNLVLKSPVGTTVTYNAVPAGSIIPQRCNRVMAATTATLITGMIY